MSGIPKDIDPASELREEDDEQALPELPDAKRERFAKQYGLPEYDADMLTQSRAMASYYEEATKLSGQPKVVSNWMMGELMRLLNAENREIEECPVKPDRLAGMVKLIEAGTISTKIAKTVFEEMYKSGKDAETVVKEQGLTQVSDTGTIEQYRILEVRAAAGVRMAARVGVRACAWVSGMHGRLLLSFDEIQTRHGWRPMAARCIRCRKPFVSITACSAASAPPA